MARRILIRAGVRFSPRDIDTKAIRETIAKSISNTRVNIAKATLSRDGKEAVKRSFSSVAFSVNKARFSREGKNLLKNSFGLIPFLVNKAKFGRAGRSQLLDSFKRIPFTIQKVRFGSAATRDLRGATEQGVGSAAAPGASVRAARSNAIQREQLDISQKAVQRFREQNVALEAVATQTTRTERAQRNLNQILAQGGLSAEAFGAKIGQVTNRFAAYLISIKAILLVQKAFNDSLRFIFEFDAALLDLQKVIQSTPEELKSLSDGLFEVSRSTGQAVTGVAQSFGIFIRAGLNTEDALRRTEAALIAANVSELNVLDSTKLVTSAMQIFGNELSNEIEFLDVLSVTADNAATTAGEVARGFLRSGAAAQAVGVTFRELTAIIAATQEATQVGGSRIGSALKTIFARLATNSEQLREQANALGATIRPGEDVFEVFRQLSEIFPNLNKEQKAQIAQTVSGKRRFTEFNAILLNFARVQELIGKQINAAGTAQRKNQVELQKLEVRVRQAGNAFAEFIDTLTGVSRGADAVTSIRQSLADIIDVGTNAVRSITDIVKALEDVQAGGFEVLSIFRGITKFGLLAVGGALIRNIIRGLRQFVGLGGAIRASLVSVSTAQRGIQSAIQSTNAAEQQGLAIEQQRLATKKQILDVENQIARQTSRDVGLRGTAQRARNVGRSIGAATRFDEPTSRISRGLGTAAFIVATTAVSDALLNLSDSFEDSADAASQNAKNTIDASRSALNFGTTLGLLAGPIFGVIGGLTAFVGSILSSNLSIRRSNQKVLEAVEQSESILINQSRAVELAGELGQKVFDDLSQGGTDVVAASTFLQRAFSELSNSSDQLVSAFNESSSLLEDAQQTIAGLARATDLRRQLEQAFAQFRERVAKIDIEVEAGGIGELGSDFRGILDSTAQTRAILQQWIPTIKTARDEFDLIKNATEAVRRGIQEGSDASFEIVSETLPLTSILSSIVAEEERLNAELDEQRIKFGDLIQLNEQLSNEAKALSEEIDKVLAASKENEDATADISGQLQIRKNLTEEIERTERLVGNTKANIERIESELINIGKQKQQQAERELKSAAQLLTSFNRIVEEQAALPGLALRRTQELQNENSELLNSLKIRRQIAVQSLSVTSLQEKNIIEEQRLRARGQQQIEQFNERRIRGIQRLQQAERDARNANLQGRADEIKLIREAFEQASAAELEELKRKVELEVQAELIDVNTDRIRAAEDALLNFRLNALKELQRTEESVIRRRIELIEELSTTSAGREFLREQFDLSDAVENELGLVGGIIIDELQSATARAVGRMVEEINILRENGADAFRILQETQSARSIAIQRIEEDIQQRREILLERLSEGNEDVADSESKLQEIRSRIPALNQRVIQSQQNLANSNVQVENALDSLVESSQKLADAQLKLNFEIALASFQARQGIGAFSSVGEQMLELRNIFNEVTDEVRGSSEAILNIRKQLLQEELNLIKGQFDALKSLAIDAATGGLEGAEQLRRQLSAAQQIAETQSLSGVDPDLIRGIERFADLVPGLEQALVSIGARQLGIDVGTINSLEDQIVKLSEGIAETGKIQVDQAVEQLVTSRQQLQKAEEQRQIAEQELQVSQQLRDATAANAFRSAQNLAATRAGFANLTSATVRQLENIRNVDNTSRETVDALSSLTDIQDRAREEIQKQREVANASLNKLDSIESLQESSLEELKNVVNALNNQVRIRRQQASIEAFPTNAAGSLTSGEFRSLAAAAEKEKSQMPAGSNLMLANTSEVVFTRRQARKIGAVPRPQSFAVNGNADFSDLSESINVLGNAVSTMLARLNDPGLVNQNININLDQNRTINVRGLDGIEEAIRNSFEQRMERTASNEEVNAISEVVGSIIDKLNEQGIVNSQGF